MEITKQFGPTQVLNGITESFQEGEKIALVGANGCGKTTLLKLLCGLTIPTTGVVRIANKKPKHSTALLGYAGHVPGLYSHLSARENLEFFARLRNKPLNATYAERLNVDLEDKRRADALSYGTRKRIAIAAAVQHEPELVVLDEPFAGLDKDSIKRVEQLLASLTCAVVLATHVNIDAHWINRTFILEAGQTTCLA